MRTANPALNKNTFERFVSVSGSDHMTIEGTVNKSFLFLILLLITAFFSWNLFLSGQLQTYIVWFYAAIIIGLIVAIVTIFKKEWSPVTAPIYALVEGFILGFLSTLI